MLLCLMPFSTIFQLNMWRSVLFVVETGVLEKTTDLEQITDKFNLIMLYSVRQSIDSSKSYNNAIQQTDVCVIKYYTVIKCHKFMLKKKQDNLNITALDFWFVSAVICLSLLIGMTPVLSVRKGFYLWQQMFWSRSLKSRFSIIFLYICKPIFVLWSHVA